MHTLYRGPPDAEMYSSGEREKTNAINGLEFSGGTAHLKKRNAMIINGLEFSGGTGSFDLAQFKRNAIFEKNVIAVYIEKYQKV
jgi:hypothetical protein